MIWLVFIMNKILRNFLYLFFSNILTKLVVMLATINIAREFGPDNFGVFNFANVFVSYFLMLSSMGLQGLGIVKISKEKSQINKFVNNIVSLRIVLSITSYIILIILTNLTIKDNYLKNIIYITSISVLINSISIDWLYNAIQEIKYVAYSLIINNIAYFVLTVVPIYFNIYKNIYIVPMASIIAMFLSNIFLIYIYMKKFSMRLRLVFNISSFKIFLKEAWPFFFSGIFATINCNMDTLMLGFMKSNFEVGLYNSVYKLVNILTGITSIIFSPMYPVFIEYFNENKINELTLLINRVRRIIYIVVIPIIVVAITLSRETILTLYGLNYINATKAFTILMIYVAIFYIREIYGYELTAWGLQKEYMNIVLISSMYNIVGNLLLIPKYSITGAAINTLISECINLTFMYRLSRDTLLIKYENTFVFKVLLSGSIMILSIILIKFILNNVFVLVAFSGIIYLSLIILLKVVKIKDLISLLGGKK